MKLKIENVSMKYKNNPKDVIKNVSLSFCEGEFATFMGASGSGKSTLLAGIAGILKPFSGKVFWDNKDLYSLSDSELSTIHRNIIGYIPQSNIFLKEYTIIENIIFQYIEKNDNAEELYNRAQKLLESLGIGEKANCFPHELSGGELKRVSIVRAVLINQKVIIADEPTSGLDEKTANIILKFLFEYANNGGIIIVASHDKQAKDYSTSVYKLIDGEVSIDEK